MEVREQSHGTHSGRGRRIGALSQAVDFTADLASKDNAELSRLTIVPHVSPKLNPAVGIWAVGAHTGHPCSCFTRAEVCLTEVDHFLSDDDFDSSSRKILGIEASGHCGGSSPHSDAHEPPRPQA